MKALYTLAALFLLSISCTKDKEAVEDVPAYEQRLIGTWTLTKVTYEAQMPSFPPGGPTTPVSGDAEDVEGIFTISRKPNEVQYDYSFTVEAPILGQNIPIPVEQKSKGSWTLNGDNTKIFLELENDNTSTLEVLLNEKNKQMFKSIIPYEIPFLGTVDVTTTITLEK